MRFLKPSIKSYLFSLFLLASFPTPLVFADINWLSATMDNDFFVGDDSGYTNGVYFSWYETGGILDGEVPAANFWVYPLLWTLPRAEKTFAVNANTLGQVMVTPADISNPNPPEGALPYSGLLAYNNTYLAVYENYADSVGLTIGVVGPISGAEETQKTIHSILGNDEPQGWDTQLDNELVFSFERGRIWRSLATEQDNVDVLVAVNAFAGTLASAINSSIYFRYGKALQNTFSVPLLAQSRTLNPIAVDGGWYVYTGMTGTYTINQIFADGNTFRNSRSVNYDPFEFGLEAGFAYSWPSLSLTFVLQDNGFVQDRNADVDSEPLDRYGSITLAWRIK